MTSSTCGVYQAESVRSHRRGKLCVIVVLHNVIFYMAASWLTLGCSFFDNGLQWRLPLALQVSFRGPQEILSYQHEQLVPCIVMVAMLQFLPDSPRWLLIRDRVEDAQEALRRYMGTNLDRSDPLVLNELASISGALALERKTQLSFKDVILQRDRSGHLKRILLGCGTQFMQV